MKQITDTYCSLKGEKQHIASLTEILCPDRIAKNVIERVKENTEKAVISVIAFNEFNDDIIKKITDEFGNVYENVDDSYAIVIADKRIDVYYSTENSIRYAACSISAHYDGGINGGIIYNLPNCEFRAMKVYIPSERNVPYFKEFIDMCMNFGYNKLLLEIGGAMEYKKHPEINEGWVEYCEIFSEYPAKARDVQNFMEWPKNSIHSENGEGGYLSQEMLKELVAYCAERGIEIIPEVPSLSHCDYLLTRHPELAENKDDPLPDTYCPSNPASYELLFDVLDEIIAVFNPKLIHIGHDEWHTFCLCDNCKGKDPAQIYADDIIKIMDYLRPKGIETMIWGEKLLNAIVGNEKWGGAHQIWRRIARDKKVTVQGKEYFVYDGFNPETDDPEKMKVHEVPPTYRSINLMPKDLKVMHWYWSFGEKFDDAYHENGLWTVYGNFAAARVENYIARLNKGMHGYAISNWSVLDKKYLQRNGLLFELVYSAFATWSRDYDEKKLTQNTVEVANVLFRYNYRDVLSKSHIEVVHSSSIPLIRRYPSFTDGVAMYDDEDRMGYYNIYYEDGTSEKVDIFFGRNIGYAPADLDGSREALDEIFKFDSNKRASDGSLIQTSCRVNLLEVTATCDYVIKDNKVYYKFLIPVNKNVARVEPEIFDKYKDALYIDSIACK